MATKSHDPEAEDIFLSALMYGVRFDDLISRITPDMLYGQMNGEDWTPLAKKYVYETILMLYHQLKSVPTKEAIIHHIGTSKVKLANARGDMVVSLVERIWRKGQPHDGTAIDSRIRIFQAYTFRYAADLLEQGAQKLEEGKGEETIKLLHEKSVLKAARTEEYSITSYKESYQERVEYVRSVQSGDDDSVKKIPFGVRGLDVETGGMSAGELIIGTLGAGRGKCLGRGTPVLMYDGTIKAVEDVQIGDLLMGPDSEPRTVKSLSRGKEKMYRITPVKGNPYEVNESHILSLKMSVDKCGSKKGEVVNISVSDYLSKPKSWKYHAKGWRVSVDFKEQRVPMDPYIFGAWLGDGGAKSSYITTEDEEIRSAFVNYATTIGCKLVKHANAGNATTYRVTRVRGKNNRHIDLLRSMGVFGSKHVPQVYKSNSREVRLQVLAGLLDTDGHLSSGGIFDYISVRKDLAEDACYLARSVGLAAYLRECDKTCTNNGVTGTYYRVCISGDLSMIPNRINRKKSAARKQKKSVLLTGVSVEPIGIGEYFGFEIDGDRLFLLGDFTVTHNTITMQDSCAYNVEQNNGCVFFTKEMTNIEIGFRFDSRFTGIIHPKFHHSLIDENDFQVWETRIGQLHDNLRIVVMKREFTPSRMADILQSLDWTFNTRMVYCDYLNIMHPTDERDRHKPTYEAGGILCEELKDLAVSRDHPIMTMCQLKPQSIDKLRITYDDIALNKLAVSANANVVFAILADEWLQQMGKAILQILKIRQKQPDMDMWDMFPVLNNIRIDSNVHGLPDHPAPTIKQNFNPNTNPHVMSQTFGKKSQDKNIKVVGADGSPLVGGV